MIRIFGVQVDAVRYPDILDEIIVMIFANKLLVMILRCNQLVVHPNLQEWSGSHIIHHAVMQINRSGHGSIRIGEVLLVAAKTNLLIHRIGYRYVSPCFKIAVHGNCEDRCCTQPNSGHNAIRINQCHTFVLRTPQHSMIRCISRFNDRGQLFGFTWSKHQLLFVQGNTRYRILRSINFKFPYRTTILRCSCGTIHTHIAGIHFIKRDRFYSAFAICRTVNIHPILCVIGHLNLVALGICCFPVELDLVDQHALSEIDIDPARIYAARGTPTSGQIAVNRQRCCVRSRIGINRRRLRSLPKRQIQPLPRLRILHRLDRDILVVLCEHEIHVIQGCSRCSAAWHIDILEFDIRDPSAFHALDLREAFPLVSDCNVSDRYSLDRSNTFPVNGEHRHPSAVVFVLAPDIFHIHVFKGEIAHSAGSVLVVDGETNCCPIYDTIAERDVLLVLVHPLPDLKAVTERPSDGILEHDIAHRLRFTRPWNPARSDIRMFRPCFRGIWIVQGDANRIFHQNVLRFHDIDPVVFTHA